MKRFLLKQAKLPPKHAFEATWDRKILEVGIIFKACSVTGRQSKITGFNINECELDTWMRLKKFNLPPLN